MPGALDHSCKECTKPYRTGPQDNSIVPGAAPVKMAVVDGIVMGPVVCFYFGL